MIIFSNHTILTYCSRFLARNIPVIALASAAIMAAAARSHATLAVDDFARSSDMSGLPDEPYGGGEYSGGAYIGGVCAMMNSS